MDLRATGDLRRGAHEPVGFGAFVADHHIAGRHFCAGGCGTRPWMFDHDRACLVIMGARLMGGEEQQHQRKEYDPDAAKAGRGTAGLQSAWEGAD